AAQVGFQRAEQALLDKDALLEGLPPVRAAELVKLGVRQPAPVVRALNGVAMRVARIAVRAPEFAPDVGVERPEIDAGLLWRVEDGLGFERDELRAAEALVENRKGDGTTRRRHGGKG